MTLSRFPFAGNGEGMPVEKELDFSTSEIYMY
jgi:hypothetical protein